MRFYVEIVIGTFLSFIEGRVWYILLVEKPSDDARSVARGWELEVTSGGSTGGCERALI